MNQEEKITLLRKYLAEIGNIIGGPTMSYSPEMEREELLQRVSEVSAIVQIALKCK